MRQKNGRSRPLYGAVRTALHPRLQNSHSRRKAKPLVEFRALRRGGSALADDVMVCIQNAVQVLFQAVLLRGPAGRPADPPALARVREPLEVPAKLAGVGGPGEHQGVLPMAHDLAHSSFRRQDARQAASHRLERRVSENVVAAREDEEVRGVEERPRVRLRAEESAGQVPRSGPRLVTPRAAIESHDPQDAFGRQASGRFECRPDSFPAKVVAHEERNDGAIGCSETLAQRSRRFRVRRRPELRRVGAAVKHLDAVGGVSVALEDLPPGSLAHREDHGRSRRAVAERFDFAARVDQQRAESGHAPPKRRRAEVAEVLVERPAAVGVDVLPEPLREPVDDVEMLPSEQVRREIRETQRFHAFPERDRRHPVKKEPRMLEGFPTPREAVHFVAVGEQPLHKPVDVPFDPAGARESRVVDRDLHST